MDSTIILILAGAGIVIIVIFIIIAAKRKPKTSQKVETTQKSEPEPEMSIPSTAPDRCEQPQIDFSVMDIHKSIKNLIITTDNIDGYRPKDQLKDAGKMIEPSMIDDHLPVEFAHDPAKIPKLPAIPVYSTMTPAQRGRYLNILKDPYDEDIENGYLILLLYNLERHIVYGNTVDAIDVIAKLRKSHYKKQQFMNISFNALAYFANRTGKYIDLISEEYDHLGLDYLIFYHFSTDKQLPADTLIKFRTCFNFPREAVIPKNQMILINVLEEILEKDYGTKGFPLKKYNTASVPRLANHPFPENPSMDKLITKYLQPKHLYEFEPFKTDVNEVLKKMYMKVMLN